MTKRISMALMVALTGGLVGCASDDEPLVVDPNVCRDAGTAQATATCLSPTQSADYYADQALRYFDTLDVDAPRDRVPTYHPQVARWEWPPWLLLTAFGRDDMIGVNDDLRSLDPSTVPIRDCRGFDTQPFARCYVVFAYEEGLCPIYEEFTFNDAGEMTFIEAWSDVDGIRPPLEGDEWAEAPSFPRLANRVPGLGSPTGIDLSAAVASDDPQVADFGTRAGDWWSYWFEALGDATPNFFALGCGWPDEG